MNKQRIILGFVIVIATLTSGWRREAHAAPPVLATGVASIQRVSVYDQSGKLVSSLVKGGAYKYQVLVENTSPSIKGRYVLESSPGVANITVGIQNGKVRCHDFYSNDRYQGAAHDFTNAVHAPELARKGTAKLTLYFKWRCPTVTAAAMDPNHQPLVNLLAATTMDPLPHGPKVPLVPNSNSGKDIYKNGPLAIRSMDVHLAGAKVRTDRLERGKRYRLGFVVTNRSGSEWGAVWNIHRIHLSVEANQSCWQFYSNDQFAGGAQRQPFAFTVADQSPLSRDKERAADVHFIWNCATRPVSAFAPADTPIVTATAVVGKSMDRPKEVRVLPHSSKVAIGGSCSGNSHCSSGVCDAGTFTQNTRKCVPAGGRGKSGEFCSHNNQCDARKGLVCRLRSRKNYGSCGR